MCPKFGIRISRYISLLFCGLISISIFLLLLFLFASYANADGPVIDFSQNEQDVVVRGEEAGDWLGEVTGSADFNRDGIDDLLIGVSGQDYNGSFSGAAYMILGSATLPSTIDLTVTRPNLSIYGATAGDALGHSVTGGDINGDGFMDMIVGADCYGAVDIDDCDVSGDQGIVYVVLGHDGGLFSTPITMDLAITSPALTIVGYYSTTERLGRAVTSGDINDDGWDDIIMGAYFASPGGRNEAGAVYVILGDSSITSTTPTTIELDNQTPALTILGNAANDRLGRSIAVGDFDGDDVDDIIVSAYRADLSAPGFNKGETYIFYGSTSFTTTSPFTVDLSTASADVTIGGVDNDDESGFYVGGGDLNNDNYDDIVIGAYIADGYGNVVNQAGEVYVIYGDGSLGASLSLATDSDVIIYGAAAGDRLGRSLVSGDVNGDNYDDLIIGADMADPGGRNNTGVTYVIFGSDEISSTILLSDTTTADIRIFGENSGDQAGRASSTGDVNGDGQEDILVGALFADNGSLLGDAGATYVVYGGTSTPTLTISPTTATVFVGHAISYTLTANNSFGDWEVTNLGGFTISPAAEGSWTDNNYTSEVSGTWVVTGTYKNIDAMATLIVTDLNRIVIEDAPGGTGNEVNATALTAGDTLTVYAAGYDTVDNYVSDVSVTWSGTGVIAGQLAPAIGISTTFSATISGTGMIQADAGNGITDTTGIITVAHSEATSLEVTPATATVKAGDTMTYTVTATDAYGNNWDATGSTTFTITPSASGSWSDNVYTSAAAGTWTVTGTYQSVNDTASLTVEHADEAASLEITPASETVKAGNTMTYTVTATDAYGNPWNVTSSAEYTITLAAGGTWNDNVYTGEVVGTWTVTGTYQSVSNTASLTVNPGDTASIDLSPVTATVKASETITYTVVAQDTYGNSWDATGSTMFQASPVAGGSWSGNVYTSQYSGTWTITGTLAGLSDTAELVVERNDPVSVAVTPDSETIATGEAIAFTVTTQDIAGNSWDVTSSAGFTITLGAGGSWSGNVYTSEITGTWTVTGTYSALNGTATLIVAEEDNHQIFLPIISKNF
ncbi:MAG: FG-GAP repeat protein [Anaerolineae bacterium]|nr:FG-GAP repeat protein [Anaerolineae bacterium]